MEGTPRLTPRTTGRRLDLVRMKRVAVGLLLLAAVLYALASALEHRHPAWGYVAAFAEAAMIGAIADWFAVVALFRRPLGLPIPHTAIIPTNKARIGRELADFICGNFLGTAQVLDKLRAFGPGDQFAAWLAQPRHARQVADHVVAAVRYGLDAFDDERVRRFVRGAVMAQLERIDVAPIAGRVLDVLTANRRHQALLDGVLLQLADLLDDEAIHDKISALIAAEVRYLSLLGLDTVAGRLAAKKMVAGVGRLIGEMGEDPDHPLRLRFDAFVADYVERLQHDPVLRERGEGLKAEVLAHPALGAYVHDLWSDVLAWLHEDLGQDDSTIRARIVDLVLSLGTKLQADAAMRRWIDDQVLDAAPRWIERYREDIRRYIASRVDAWDTAEMTNELERNIGRDLQFVRINGTLVGGLIGLAIHAVTVWARGA